MEYPAFAVTVDIALFTIQDDVFKILLIERGGDPYCGDLALPGGFVRPDEDLDAAAARELKEETSLADGAWHLEQFAAYGDPERDPRMRTVTVAFWAITSDPLRPRGGGDAAAARLVPVDRIESGGLRLAFDHDRIVEDAVKRVRSGLETTTVATQFCPPAFTVAELRKVYETIWNTPLDPGNFQRFVRDSGAFESVPSATPNFRGPPGDDLVSGQTVRQGVRGRPASRWKVREGGPRPLARPLRRRVDGE